MVDFGTITILLIEDEPLVRRLAAEVLRHLGIGSVVEAGEGGEGLAQAERHRPDLVLCDLRMEPVDGLAFVAALRRHPDPALSRVPVLILTIDDTPATVLSAARCGADGYLLKPVMPETLRHHVERALEGRAGAVV